MGEESRSRLLCVETGRKKEKMGAISIFGAAKLTYLRLEWCNLRLDERASRSISEKEDDYDDKRFGVSRDQESARNFKLLSSRTATKDTDFFGQAHTRAISSEAARNIGFTCR